MSTAATTSQILTCLILSVHCIGRTQIFIYDSAKVRKKRLTAKQSPAIFSAKDLVFPEKLPTFAAIINH
jgi:hypothetical protein